MAMLNIDFKNAFSLVDRQPFTKEVKTELPSMYNWVVYCNGNESLLDYDGSTIQSSRGVQQGDPLGPLFFALILNTLVAKINASLGIHIGFFNNGTLIGCKSDLLKALDILSTDGNWSGFEVNFEKCELFYPNQSELSDFPGNIKRLSSAGVDLLGSYIGCPESRERSLDKKHFQRLSFSKNYQILTRFKLSLQFSKTAWVSARSPIFCEAFVPYHHIVYNSSTNTYVFAFQ